MSRLTASPFHKPSPFEFPRVPLSPPETMSDRMGSAHPTTVSVVGATPIEPPHVDSEPVFYSPTPETAGARFRRVSSLAYHSSGLRENRERAVQRSSKFFVVVIPPPSLLQEHGQLGHTLSLGPRHRLSQGILLPLFPTMYGQLSAIAKEFNFPSTAGICLYFHFTENGITATPRISDESWQIIWSNVFDPSISSPRVPIVGKLEFDIDIRHARWYSAWIASAHREHVDVPASVGPSTAPSLAHFRGDSRNTELEINFQDDQIDNESVSPPSITRHGRHVPRKLSLVDRLDSSLRAVARTAAQISPERSAISANALSPIFQEDEPKTAKLQDSLAKRVKSWRASASLTPSALAAKGQTSLEPANLPNTMSLDDVGHSPDVEELNLEDFTWSVSSLGPNDWEEGSVASWARLPSVHLANRMESSVCMTPSVCTSFGPSDYTLPSPKLRSARVMTPDIAHRMYEDCPPTPSTATSWGPASEYPASPMSFSRVSSVDLGDRVVFSPPPTPITATSWGPPSEYPSSPMTLGRTPSVHLGDRLVFSPPPTPSTATSWGPVSWPDSPVTPFHIRTPDVGQRAFNLEDVVLSGAPWKQVWPYYQQHLVMDSAPWSHVWPYTSARAPDVELNDTPWRYSWPYNSYANQGPSPVIVRLPCSYPSLNIYSSVYPYLDLYPAEPSNVQRSSYLNSLDIYPAVNEQHQSDKIINIEIASAWPDFIIYPAIASTEQSHSSYTSQRLTLDSVRRLCIYPSLKIYPSVYPHFDDLYPAEPSTVEHTPYLTSIDIYPVTDEVQHSNKTLHVKVASAWPVCETYTPISSIEGLQDSYPKEGNSPVSVCLPCSYPSLRIYPSVYPYFDDIYPAELLTVQFYPDSLNIYPAVNEHLQVSKVVPVEVASAWPAFEIYPPIVNMKSAQASQRRIAPSILVRTPCFYPSLKIYPSVYPYFDDLYPTEPRSEEIVVYPQFSMIYPPLNNSDVEIRSVAEKIPLQGKPAEPVTKFPWAYPIIDLYPAVYPYVTPYPYSTGAASSETSVSVVLNAKSRQYPDFILYSCRQYPDFDLYPPQKSENNNRSEIGTGYGVFDLYPAIYPHILPYAPVLSVTPRKSLSIRRGVRSHRSLHDEVFPHGVVSTPTGTPQIIGEVVASSNVRVHRSHRELHDEVFSDGLFSTPNETILRESRILMRPEVPPRPVGARLRSGSISRRPSSSAAPPPTSGLPPRPNFRLSAYNELGSANSPVRSVDGPGSNLSTPPSAPLPVRSSTTRVGSPTTGTGLQSPVSLRRVASSAAASTRTSSLRNANSGLESVSELANSSLERSASTGLRRTVILPNSRNAEPSTTHKKRDSVVLQRIRALELESDPSRHSLNKTLKEFPLPPPPTGGLPPVPTHRTSLLTKPRS